MPQAKQILWLLSLNITGSNRNKVITDVDSADL
jgi:hypothetical protein